MAPLLIEYLGLPLEVERHVMYWFETLGSLKPFLPYHFRISIRRPYDGHMFYGFHVQDDKSLI